LIVFAELAGILLALNVAQLLLIQKSKLVLREGLVEDLPAGWLAAARLLSRMPARSTRIAIDGFMRTPSTSPISRSSGLSEWNRSSGRSSESYLSRFSAPAASAGLKVSPFGSVARRSVRVKKPAIVHCIADINNADIDLWA
jgi:hypothetical protein